MENGDTISEVIMESFNIFGIALVVIGVIGLILLTIGIILLVNGIRNTIRKNKRIGRIIGGAVMIFISLTLVFFSACFLIVDKASVDIAQDPDTMKMYDEITDALKENDENALYETFAYQTLSGETLELEDAEKLFELIGSDIDSVNSKVRGVGHHNGTSTVDYYYEITTEDDARFTLIVTCIVDSEFDCYEGVQNIIVKNGANKFIYEIGEKPMFD